MTISYTLDVSRRTGWDSFIRILARWRGSVWKAVCIELSLWLIIYLIISFIYRHVLSISKQETFEYLAHYLDAKMDTTLPLTFMLGFFVTQVVSRWNSILNGLGWIDELNFIKLIKSLLLLLKLSACFY
jgi:bestrophin, other